ncbi:hypothetical protein [Scatolibacter rhodanostii]|uniref:hypothetical protein n=1 Tax=Scatolibacter rhodanostii TaxID=2014781 RepID=UPI000C073414|nr:hypothetical protein [Scatolibacter rhodanostii]
MDKPIFREKSLQKISSPDELSQYIKVASPGVWLILFFVLTMLVALIIWCFFGELPTTITTMGYAKNGEIVCYLSPKQAEEITDRVSVSIGESKGELISVSETPLSQAEIALKYSEDYIVDTLAAQEWNLEIKILANGVKDGLHEIILTTETVRPISFLLN